MTNGIDHRRWLAQINPGLHELVAECLGGDEYLVRPEELIRFKDFADDSEVRARMNAIKKQNKERLAAFAMRNDGFALNTEALIDVQVKRLHEYKRQLLCAMRIASLQLQLHDDPNMDFAPRSFVFGAKAAAGYRVAKRIIELLLSMMEDINNDPVCKDRLQLLFVENYRVSAAEAIVPAAQISEQISTAGKEASGTGCMLSLYRHGEGEGFPSMEAYIFRKDVLLNLMDLCRANNQYLFHRDAITRFLNDGGRMAVYVHEGYANSVRSVEEYYDISRDMLKPEIRHQLFCRPVRAKTHEDVSTYYGENSRSVNSLVGDNCIIEGDVENCIIFSGVHVAAGARLRDCIIMKGCEVGAGVELNCVIADKACKFSPGSVLVGSPKLPTVVPKGTEI